MGQTCMWIPSLSLARDTTLGKSLKLSLGKSLIPLNCGDSMRQFCYRKHLASCLKHSSQKYYFPFLSTNLCCSEKSIVYTMLSKMVITKI